MDFKEPSVHASQRSRSVTNRSINQKAQQTIDSVASRVSTDPEKDVLNRTMYPMIISQLVQEIVMLFIFYTVWHYTNNAVMQQFAIVYPICNFISVQIPRAISQAQLGRLNRFIVEAKIKMADEAMTVHFVCQAIYFGVSLIACYLLTVTFTYQAGITENDKNYVAVYIVITCSAGTLLNIFNNSTEALLILEAKNFYNFIRSTASSVSYLAITLVSYQYVTAQKKALSLTPLAISQLISQIIPAVIVMLNYQDFTALPSQGILRAKVKYIKSISGQAIKEVFAHTVPRVLQFGSIYLLNFAAQLVVTQTYLVDSDIKIARLGLFIYILSYNLFSCVSTSFQVTSEQILSLNLQQKKYIRSKGFLLKGLVWGVFWQVVSLIIALVAGTSIIEFFIPDSQALDKEYYLLYGMKYITYSYLMPILQIFFNFSMTVTAIEDDIKIGMLQSIIPLIVGVVTLLVTQFMIGDRAELFWIQYYADLFSGISGAILLVRKIFEVMQLAKIELRRLKRKKRLEEEGVAEKIEGKD
ncbi:DinF_protein [Hexamita inflata]|uniref:DinF protein n=1 Tax=Hexamita inflata TaxID=28002 RepID=A0AA86U340_9EUKA|nr:DinF protein [Hexamita inflata]